MTFFLASLPILLILYLMVVLRWGAARAGAAGYLSALAIAILAFGATPELLGYAHTKALLLSLDVLLIIWAAFLLYRISDEAGAIRIIGDALPQLTADKGMQALIIGWVFASFLQGVGGFGVPVAVIAPILVSLGFSPLAAVVIPSIGHGWSVTFGSMGSSFQALLATTDLSAAQLAPLSAAFLGIAALCVGLMVAHAADGWGAVRRLGAPILIIGSSMALGQYLTATLGPWNIGAFIGSLIGLLVSAPLAQRMRGDPTTPPPDGRSLLIALSGYGVLIALTLIIQLIPEVRAFLGSVVIQVPFPELQTTLGYTTPAGMSRKIPLFQHAGMILCYASLISYLIYQRAGFYRPGTLRRILNGTLTRVMSSSVSILSMVSMAVIMEHTGMTEALARGLAQSVGRLYPLIAAWIGALGAFMTGSNTNSNVVFAALQMHTAELLNFSVPVILAAQTAGAALASTLAPTKVVVGASTAGMEGREGEVIRSLGGYITLLVLLISLLTAIGVSLYPS